MVLVGDGDSSVVGDRVLAFQLRSDAELRVLLGTSEERTSNVWM